MEVLLLLRWQAVIGPLGRTLLTRVHPSEVASCHWSANVVIRAESAVAELASGHWSAGSQKVARLDEFLDAEVASDHWSTTRYLADVANH